MTTIIEIREKSIKVVMNDMATLVAKYVDDDGVYFFDEKLKKKYVADVDVADVDVADVDATPTTTCLKKPIKKEYRFEVEYAHKGRIDGFAFCQTKIKAYSSEEAFRKAKKRFRKIFEISEV